MTQLELSEKRCPRCGQVKPISEFYRNSVARDGASGHCAACNREYQAERRRADPERVRQLHRENQRRWRDTREGRERTRELRRLRNVALKHLRRLHLEEYKHLYELAKRGDIE